MANRFQQAIYYLSNAVPLALMTALVWWCEFRTWSVPTLLLVIALIVTVMTYVFFFYGKQASSIKSVSVTKIVSKDSWMLAYVITYLLPFTYLVISNYKIITFVIFVLILLWVLIPSSIALPSILLYLAGYHFYELETVTGIGDYILISKRRQIRSNQDITTVKRVFERILIDTKEGK